MLRMVARLKSMAVAASSQGILHQHDVGGVDGDVRARADGDADVRAGQRRGVVDAVADHGHLVALLLQARG